MTSLPPENAPQLGTCNRGKYHVGAHPNFATCKNWKPVAAPENQPRPTCEDCGRPARVNSFDPNIFVCDNCETYWKPGEAQGGVPQENADYQRGWDDAMLSIQEPGEPVETGAHPPPDEFRMACEWLAVPDHHIGIPEHNRQCGGETNFTDGGCLRCVVEIALAAYARARTPQPVTVTAPVAPSKLSAQEEYLGLFNAARKFIQTHGYPEWDGTADGTQTTLTSCANFMARYASSSNAALQQEVTHLENYKFMYSEACKSVSALEGQLREARECVELHKSLASAKIPFCDHLAQYSHTEDGGKHIMCLICEVERLQEALRKASAGNCSPRIKEIARAALGEESQ